MNYLGFDAPLSWSTSFSTLSCDNCARCSFIFFLVHVSSLTRFLVYSVKIFVFVHCRKVIEAPGALRDIERLKTLLSQLNAFRKSMNTQAANVQSVSVSLQGTLSPSQYVKLLSLSARAKAGSV